MCITRQFLSMFKLKKTDSYDFRNKEVYKKAKNRIVQANKEIDAMDSQELDYCTGLLYSVGDGEEAEDDTLESSL
jgi:hypothetical protein